MNLSIERLQTLAGITPTTELLEASANDRYREMFAELFKIPTLDTGKLTTRVNHTIDIVRQAMKKDDGIIWALRFGRIVVVDILINETTSRAEEALRDVLTRIKNGYVQRIMSNDSTLTAQDVQSSANYMGHVWLTQIEHYLSLPIPKIQNHVFKWELPSVVTQQFKELEDAWKAERVQQVAQLDTDSVVLSFRDGVTWFNLNKSSCEQEGDAMGHCGNTATPEYDDTILSLRQPLKRSGGIGNWRPILTFILDGDGFLGEMKGRANEKPSPKYHQYIIPLLKLGIIKGIKGGGHDPRNNFSIKDLDDDVESALVHAKPTLGGLRHIYDMYGFDNELTRHLINAATESAGVGYGEIKDNSVLLEEWDNLSDFLHSFTDQPLENLVDAIKSIKDVIATHADDSTRSVEEFYQILESIDDDSIRGFARLMRQDGYAIEPTTTKEMAVSLYDQKIGKSYEYMEYATANSATPIDIKGYKGWLSKLRDRLEQYIEAGYEWEIHECWLSFSDDNPNVEERGLQLTIDDESFISVLDAITSPDEYEDDEYYYAASTLQYHNSWSVMADNDDDYHRAGEGLQGHLDEDALEGEFDTWNQQNWQDSRVDPNEAGRILEKLLRSGIPAPSDEGQLRMFDSRYTDSEKQLIEAYDVNRIKRLAGL